MTDTAALADFIATTSYADIPGDVATIAKSAIRDHIGVVLLGGTSAVGNTIRQYAIDTYPGDEATILGGGRANRLGAALANGSFAHIDDFDDTYESIVIHPSAPIVPAALAIAEAEDCTGTEFITAISVGAEVLYRVGQSVYPEHYHNGWHITATVGTLGAAAATASLLDFSAKECRQVLGIAASNAPNSLKRNMGSTIKLTYPGQGAQRGVESALLVTAGITANDAVFEGKNGYCAAMAPGRSETPTIDTTELGSDWALRDLGFKLYPSPVITQTIISTLESVLESEDTQPEDISDIEVFIDDSIDVLKGPTITTGYEGKFSIEFLLALVLVEGSVRPQHFSDDMVADDRIRAAMDRISTKYVNGLFENTYFDYGTRLKITTEDGREITRGQRNPFGMPSNPASDERLREKFVDCATTVFDRIVVDDLNQHIMAIDEPGSITAVFDILAAPTE